MNSRPDLKLDWCSHDAAKYAVEHWHYSKRMPKSKLAKIGVWEDGRFVGAVVYGVGAGEVTNGHRFGLAKRFEMAELVRVALTSHNTPTSRIISIACRLIHGEFPKLQLLTSFADSNQRHVGTIYQAAGWTYIGAKNDCHYRVNGAMVHPRTLYDRYGVGGQSIPWLRDHVDSNAERIRMESKFHYLLPLNAAMTAVVAPMAQPYPKRPKDSSEPPAIHAGEGGAAPTRTLHNLFPLRERFN